MICNMPTKQKKGGPLGLDLSGLASEKLSRSEAIDLMVEEARAGCAARLQALAEESKALATLSCDEIRAIVALPATAIESRFNRLPELQVSRRSDGTHTVELNVCFVLPSDGGGGGLPPELAARVARAVEVQAQVESERGVERALSDRTRVRGVLLRGLLSETPEGRALLSQLGSAAERFRDVVRGRGRALLR